jgi:hypothetical protein
MYGNPIKYLYVKPDTDFKRVGSFFREDGGCMSLLNGGFHPPTVLHDVIVFKTRQH